MSLQDLVITPIFFVFFFLLAWFLKPRLSDSLTHKFFIPALVIKFFGAIALGLLYQYYYNGGDTYNYYYWGSKWIWEAFLESPSLAFQILLSDATLPNGEIYNYTSHMVFYGSGGADFVSRLAGIFAMITGNTYSSIALFFAFYSFLGSWWLFKNLQAVYPTLSRHFALAIFCLPSVVIWGSGLMKDTLVLGSVGFIFGSLISLFETKKGRGSAILLMIIGLYIIYEVKVYVLLCLFPSILIYAYMKFKKSIRSTGMRLVIAPFLFLIMMGASYLGISTIPAEESRYSLEKISGTAQATAWWHGYVSEQQDGSGYTLGSVDYSGSGILTSIIPAINVTLFRPYLWESNSFLMLLSALESFLFLVLTLRLIINRNLIEKIKFLMSNPLILSFMAFCLTFAFAIGVVTNNFGALVRYKIPILPLFLISLIVLHHIANKRAK